MHAWRWLRRQLRARRAALRFCFRLTASALIAFALMQFWTLPLRGLWAVLTAVVVIQTSIGGSLRATTDYVIGTLAGAVYATAVGMLAPHTTTTLELMGLLALAVAPLAYLAALSPSFRVAPFTALIVLILAPQFGQSPLASALTRLGEVVLGGIVAVLVSLVVLPNRAHGFGLEAAKRALNQLADTLPRLLAGLTHPIEDSIPALQDSVGRAVTAFQTIIDEVQREQFIGLPLKPDPGPLSRTLLRLRHDFVILGRAAAKPLSEKVAQRLEPHLSAVAAMGQQELRACAASLATRHAVPDSARLEAAIDAYVAEVAALRREGVTLPLSENQAEQLFAVGFALDQMRQNFRDLVRAIKDWSQAFAR